MRGRRHYETRERGVEGRVGERARAKDEKESARVNAEKDLVRLAEGRLVVGRLVEGDGSRFWRLVRLAERRRSLLASS